MAPDQELTFLKNRADMLKQQLDQIDARVKELGNIGRDTADQKNVAKQNNPDIVPSE